MGHSQLEEYILGLGARLSGEGSLFFGGPIYRDESELEAEIQALSEYQYRQWRLDHVF